MATQLALTLPVLTPELGSPAVWAQPGRSLPGPGDAVAVSTRLLLPGAELRAGPGHRPLFFLSWALAQRPGRASGFHRAASPSPGARAARQEEAMRLPGCDPARRPESGIEAHLPFVSP